jgi:dihydrofolate synthase/folylpolyglutamate synthase
VAVATKPARSTNGARRSGARTGKARFAKSSATPSSANTYARAVRFINTLTDYERLRIVRYNTHNFDLDRMRTLLRKLGNPQEHFRSVHIAGTKGKGSTCAMVASMLQACGYRVGVYTSPHLVDLRERIQVDGRMISHADFARLVRNIEPIIAHSRPDHRRTARSRSTSS